MLFVLVIIIVYPVKQADKETPVDVVHYIVAVYNAVLFFGSMVMISFATYITAFEGADCMLLPTSCRVWLFTVIVKSKYRI